MNRKEYCSPNTCETYCIANFQAPTDNQTNYNPNLGYVFQYLPDSCCKTETTDCGEDVDLSKNETVVSQKFYTQV